MFSYTFSNWFNRKNGHKISKVGATIWNMKVGSVISMATNSMSFYSFYFYVNEYIYNSIYCRFIRGYHLFLKECKIIIKGL